MASFKVKASLLNVRTEPVDDFNNKKNIIGKLRKDAPFESIDEKTNKLGVWYKNANKHWVWGEGLETTGNLSIPILNRSTSVDFSNYLNLPFIPEKMSWAHRFLEIPFIWQDIQTAGKDVVIGIIDTGVDTNHDDLKFSFLNSSIHVDNNGIKDSSGLVEERIQDEFGHGTQMAGMIVASGKKVYGIAPECRLVVVKLDGILGRTAKSIAEGITYLISENVDLISISQTASDEMVLREAVESSHKVGIPVFASIGDNHVIGFKKIDKDSFPACYADTNNNDLCIAVGSFDESGNVCDFSQRNGHLSLLAPGSENSILTTSLKNTTILSAGATSIATAIAAGCFALIISFLKKKNRLDLKGSALEQLLIKCDDKGDIIGKDPDHGFGNINLRNALAQIKTLL